MAEAVTSFVFDKLVIAYSSLSYWSRSTGAQVYHFKDPRLYYVHIQDIQCVGAGEEEGMGDKNKSVSDTRLTLARVSDQKSSFWCFFTQNARKQCAEICSGGLTADLTPCIAQISVDRCYFVKSAAVETILFRKQPSVIPVSAILDDFSLTDDRAVPVFESNTFIYVSRAPPGLTSFYSRLNRCSPLEDCSTLYDRSKVQDKHNCRLTNGASRRFSSWRQQEHPLIEGRSGTFVRQTKRVFLMPKFPRDNGVFAAPTLCASTVNPSCKELRLLPEQNELVVLPEFDLTQSQDTSLYEYITSPTTAANFTNRQHFHYNVPNDTPQCLRGQSEIVDSQEDNIGQIPDSQGYSTFGIILQKPPDDSSKQENSMVPIEKHSATLVEIPESISGKTATGPNQKKFDHTSEADNEARETVAFTPPLQNLGQAQPVTLSPKLCSNREKGTVTNINSSDSVRENEISEQKVSGSVDTLPNTIRDVSFDRKPKIVTGIPPIKPALRRNKRALRHNALVERSLSIMIRTAERIHRDPSS